jgi:hypothetical protein
MLEVCVLHPKTGKEVARTEFDREFLPIWPELERQYPGHWFEFWLDGRRLDCDEVAELLNFGYQIER